jgi:hypothetical protein
MRLCGESLICLDIRVVFSILALLISGFIYFAIKISEKGRRNVKKLKYKVAAPVILNGRIYPTLLQLVQNRYYILAGFVASTAYIFSTEDIKKLFQCGIILYLLFVVFWLAIISHNLFNYVANAIEKAKLEGGHASCRMETGFYFFMTFLIIASGWIFLSWK